MQICLKGVSYILETLKEKMSLNEISLVINKIDEIDCLDQIKQFAHNTPFHLINFAQNVLNIIFDSNL